MKIFASVISALAFTAPSFAEANNACSAPAIATAADVTTSYGSEYQVKTYFRTPKESAAVFVGDDTSTMAVEGGLAWTSRGDEAVLAGDAEKGFVIGHQFHAMALMFDEIATDIEPVSDLDVGGRTYDGRKGSYPFGGTMTLIEDASGRAHMLIMHLLGESEITVTYDDWRAASGGSEFPYSVLITHEENEFYYRYTEVSVLIGDSAKDSIDFQEAYPAPNINEVQIQRVHRAMLAAHCRGDAKMIADLTAPEAIIANRGEITRTTPNEIEAQFKSLFSRIQYTGYHDLEDPIISVSENSDIGWIIVNPRAEGRDIESGETFSAQWAWVMLMRKVDGVWRHAGNASNLKAQ